MIIIDHDADTKLLHTLERLRAESQQARCVYFNLAASSQPEGIRDKVIASARGLVADEAQVYFCGDGDIFILAPVLHSRDARLIIEKLGAQLHIPSSQPWALVLELPLDLGRLLLIVERKISLQRLKAEEAKRKQMEEMAERKRQSILGGQPLTPVHQITKRRSERRKPEIMIIEDDIFSRRLVENVLKADYALTGLGEASLALDTYARIAPNLLLLDINLPDVSGHELLEKIISMDPAAYVVMLSGNADRENVTQAMRLGAKGFIAKPFTKDKLMQYIERCPTMNTAH